MRNIQEIVEAVIFASGEPLPKKDLIESIPALTTRELNKIIENLKLKYSGESGILLLTFNEKLQFSTNPKYGEILADVLTPIREKQLSHSLLEVLSIVAYKQPITRLEIEEIRGKDPDYALSVLMKINLIEVKGRRDTVGRPILFGTSEEFLKKFQLENLENLPNFKEVLERIALLDKNFATDRDTLYFKRDIEEEPDIIIVGGNRPNDDMLETSEVACAIDVDEANDENLNEYNDSTDDDEDFDEIPDFLKNEDIQEIY